MKTSFFAKRKSSSPKSKKAGLMSSAHGTDDTTSMSLRKSTGSIPFRTSNGGASTIEEGKFFSQDSSGHLNFASDPFEKDNKKEDNEDNNNSSKSSIQSAKSDGMPPLMRKSTGSMRLVTDDHRPYTKYNSTGTTTTTNNNNNINSLSSQSEHVTRRISKTESRPKMEHQDARRSLSPKPASNRARHGMNISNPVPFFTTAGKNVVKSGVKASQVVSRVSHVAVDSTVAVFKGAGNATGTVVGGASNAVVDAGNAVGNTMVQGGKVIVGGTTQAIVGTTSVVGYGGKTVFKGTKKAYQTFKNATQRSLSNNNNRFATSKSKWEEGLEVIDSLLDPQGEVYQVMTPVQREQLAGVKKLLLKAPGEGNGHTTGNSRRQRFHHIPHDLIRMSNGKGPGRSTRNLLLRQQSRRGDYSSSLSSINLRDSTQSSVSCVSQSKYILEEYAGIKDMDTDSIISDNDLDDMDREPGDGDGDDNDPIGGETLSTAEESSDSGISGSGQEFHDDDDDDVMVTSDRAAQTPTTKTAKVESSIAKKEPQGFHIPAEFSNLSRDAQLKVWELLKWESLGKWDFDIFELDKLTQGKPLLFMGWAVIGAPYSQHAMAKELGIQSDIKTLGGYKFTDLLQIPSDKLCNFIRAIEQDYKASNEYHNAIHGADVVQGLHALIQSAKKEDYLKKCPKLDLFSILLAAICHDVCHPGTNNAFHVKMHSELAVMYNDSSVLENWHVAHAFSIMLGLDLLGSHALVKNFPHTVPSENNLLCHVTTEQFGTVRKLMIDAILHTDMTNHFEMVNDARGMLVQQKDGSIKTEEVTWKMLKYMLHMADISNQARVGNLAQQWTDRCMEEFFTQGDVEASLGMPISPLCDRKTVVIPDSQVGFIQFVVEPAFDVLGDYIPFVKDDVMPLIEDNLLRNLELQEQLEDEADAAAVKNSTDMDKKESATGKEGALAEESSEGTAPSGSAPAVGTEDCPALIEI